MEIMMALGDFRFQLDTAAYQELERTQNYDWKFKKPVGKRPIGQFLGIGEEKINLIGTIYPHFRGGLQQLQNMRDIAGKGESLLLVDGRGKVWGEFCITMVREKQTVFAAGGLPLRQEFHLEMMRQAEDIE